MAKKTPLGTKKTVKVVVGVYAVCTMSAESCISACSSHCSAPQHGFVQPHLNSDGTCIDPVTVTAPCALLVRRANGRCPCHPKISLCARDACRASLVADLQLILIPRQLSSRPSAGDLQELSMKELWWKQRTSNSRQVSSVCTYHSYR